MNSDALAWVTAVLFCIALSLVLFLTGHWIVGFAWSWVCLRKWYRAAHGLEYWL